MPVSLRAQLYAAIYADYSDDPNGSSRVAHVLNPNPVAAELLTGAGVGQADREYAATRTLAASASEDLDLAGAALKDALGNNVNWSKVKAILISAAATNTNNVEAGNAATNAFVGPFGAAAHRIVIPPGGFFMVAAPVNGWTVTPGTGDLLKIANSGGGTSVTYTITLIGVS